MSEGAKLQSGALRRRREGKRLQADAIGYGAFHRAKPVSEGAKLQSGALRRRRERKRLPLFLPVRIMEGTHHTMELEFETKITANILFDYMLHHTYNSPSGILGSGIGAVLVVGFFGTQNILYLLAGMVLLVYLPCSLYLSSLKQIQNTPAFKEPLCYRMNEEGIQVSQGGESQLQKWENMYRAVSTRNSIIVYNTKVNAWIFPRRDLGAMTPGVIEMISTHMPAGKVKIRW